MENAQTKAYLLAQWAAYPALQLEDLLKALHQSVFGPGHFVADRAAAEQWLQRELAAGVPMDGPDVEALDGPYCRVHLRYLYRAGLAPETLLRAFVLSAEAPAGDAAQLEKKLSVLLDLVKTGTLPFSYEEAAERIAAWRKEGFPARHHSEVFRAAYAPAYRVVRKELARALPLLAEMDKKLANQSRITMAIEGGSASGKSTLSAALERLYECNVFHMDDFFLRPEQRTAERFAQPGGNVDWERFLEEVLQPLTQGKTVRYRRYDCCTQQVLPAVEIAPKALNIVEGAYSMHPALAAHYDLSVFLRISPQLQQERVRKRNPDMAERFFEQWIPLEMRYFAAMEPERRCDLVLEEGL